MTAVLERTAPPTTTQGWWAKTAAAARYEYLMQVRRPAVWLVVIGLIALRCSRPFPPDFTSTTDHATLVADWAINFTMLTPIGVGAVLADRVRREARLGLDDLLTSTPAGIGPRLWGKAVGAAAATVTPVALCWAALLVYLAAGHGAGVLPVGIEVFAAVILPGLVFISACSLTVPYLTGPALYRLGLVGYWVWGNMVGPRYGIPTPAGHALRSHRRIPVRRLVPRHHVRRHRAWSARVHRRRRPQHRLPATRRVHHPRDHPPRAHQEKPVMTAPDVTITDLTATFRRGRVRALDRVNLRLPAGMVGLLGPNGAGKTTLMRVLTGVLQPTSGTVSVDGTDLTSRSRRQEVKAATGYLPQELGLYPELTARQFLDYLALLKGITDRRARRDRIHEVLELVSLGDVAHRKLKTYSGGMKRRVGIAQAILNNPRLLIVDEPTVGLDPEERLRFRGLLATLAGDRTVLLSTHIVDDIVQTCPNVVVIEHGGIAFQGAIGDLATRAEGLVWHVTRPATAPPPDLPTVTIAPGMTGTTYRVISSRIPAPDAESVSATVEDGYIALMHGIAPERAQHPGPDLRAS